MNIKDLKNEINYKWKIQTAKESIIVCVPYIDSRDAQQLLDDVVGEMNWVNNYRRDENGNLVCAVSIFDKEKGIWISKEDVGTESHAEKEKGEYSDAFKRACVHWGIGRFLYHIPSYMFFKSNIKKVGNKFFPTDNNGKPLRDGKSLTDFIEKNTSSKIKPKIKNIYEEIDQNIKIFFFDIMGCPDVKEEIKQKINKGNVYNNIAKIFDKNSWKEIKLDWLKTSQTLIKENSDRILTKIEETFTDLEDYYKSFRQKIYKSKIDKSVKDALKTEEFKKYLSEKLFNNDIKIISELRLDDSVKERIKKIYDEFNTTE